MLRTIAVGNYPNGMAVDPASSWLRWAPLTRQPTTSRSVRVVYVCLMHAAEQCCTRFLSVWRPVPWLWTSVRARLRAEQRRECRGERKLRMGTRMATALAAISSFIRETHAYRARECHRAG